MYIHIFLIQTLSFKQWGLRSINWTLLAYLRANVCITRPAGCWSCYQASASNRINKIYPSIDYCDCCEFILVSLIRSFTRVYLHVHRPVYFLLSSIIAIQFSLIPPSMSRGSVILSGLKRLITGIASNRDNNFFRSIYTNSSDKVHTIYDRGECKQLLLPIAIRRSLCSSSSSPSTVVVGHNQQEKIDMSEFNTISRWVEKVQWMHAVSHEWIHALSVLVG